MDRYPISAYEQSQYDHINTVLTWCFFGEMVIKIIGLGPHYIKDKVNIFDAAVVLITSAENVTDLVLAH